MKEEFKNKGVFRMADMIAYKENAIDKIEVESNDGMKYFLLSFDKHVLLAEHTAPGDGVFTVLEGKAAITYKGEEYNLSAGENFVFEKGAVHSVYATEKLKVSLVIAL